MIKCLFRYGLKHLLLLIGILFYLIMGQFIFQYRKLEIILHGKQQKEK